MITEEEVDDYFDCNSSFDCHKYDETNYLQ